MRPRIRRPSPPDIQSILNLIQACAIVIGGCWIVYRYLAHERSTLTITQQLAAAQRDLRIKELQRTVELQQSELELKALAKAGAERDLIVAGQTRFSRSAQLQIVSARPVSSRLNQYIVTYSFYVTNDGDLPLELSLLIIDFFVGIPQQGADPKISVRPIRAPDIRGGSLGAVGDAVKWQYEGSYGSVRRESVRLFPWWAKAPYPDPEFVTDGDATGPMQPKQSIGAAFNYSVCAPAGSYVAFAVTYCFDGCSDRTRHYMKRDYSLLAVSTKP